MINLLPKAYKAEILAGRVNVILIRYIFIIVIAFAFLVLILAGSIFLLSTTKQSSDLLIEANATKAAQYSATTDEINRLTTSLGASRAVLDGQISYSKVLTAIAAAMPAGTVIGGLELTDSSFDGTTPTIIQVYAINNDAAVLVGQNFQSVQGISQPKIESISESGGITGYPVSATLTVTLNRSLGL